MTRPAFLVDFVVAFRYVLQQHERAVRSRMRADDGDVAAIADANHFECLLEEGAQRLALVIHDLSTANGSLRADGEASTSADNPSSSFNQTDHA